MFTWQRPMAKGASAPMAVSTSPRAASPGVRSEVGAVAPVAGGWAVGVLSVASAAAAAAAGVAAAAEAEAAAVAAGAAAVAAVSALSEAGATQGRAYGTDWKGKKLPNLATQGFHVVQASTLEDGGLTADDQSDLHDFTKRALKKKPHLPRVHEPAGQQTLCAPRPTCGHGCRLCARLRAPDRS